MKLRNAGFGVTGAALAVLFLFPLLWSAWASVRTPTGFGTENYRRLLMVPYATILIALYVLLGWIGLQDSLIGLSLGGTMSSPPAAAVHSAAVEPVDGQRHPARSVCAPGHNGFFRSPDGTEDWMVYHANSSTSGGCDMNRSTRAQKFTWNADGTPNFGVPVALGTQLAVPSGEPAS